MEKLKTRLENKRKSFRDREDYWFNLKQREDEILNFLSTVPRKPYFISATSSNRICLHGTNTSADDLRITMPFNRKFLVEYLKGEGFKINPKEVSPIKIEFA